MGGHVAKKLGDGILALFGYPVAHENDAERRRAQHCRFNARCEAQSKNGCRASRNEARIGLETGPRSLDAAGEIFGDVANVAARVQAEPSPAQC